MVKCKKVRLKEKIRMTVYSDKAIKVVVPRPSRVLLGVCILFSFSKQYNVQLKGPVQIQKNGVHSKFAPQNFANVYIMHTDLLYA